MPLTLQSFVERWSGAQRAERANYQLFLSELCEVLDLPRPDPAGPDAAANAYVFERAVRLHRSDGKITTGRIDLYRRGCFVLECKQYGEAKPESMPVETQKDLSVYVNKAAAERMGVTIPEDVLAGAEVVG